MLKNFCRHLTKNEWRDMSIETQWVALEVMGFPNAEKPTESKTVTINVAQEESARPKTATAASALGIPNVSRRPNARAVEIGIFSAGKWESFRRCRKKRYRFQRGRPQRRNRPDGKVPDGKRDTEGKDSKGKDSVGKD